ncbi:MAG: hypothetical protein R3277_03395 [Brumimicrobium sp.]|nr:hypothetical protein [Brumimicrobium sp.]
MNKAIWLGIGACLTILLTYSCNSGKKDEVTADNFTDYFFPTDSVKPFIYVFQEQSNPLDEKFFRIYRMETQGEASLVVERFNASFRITEGFTHDLKDSLRVVDYMVVDKDGIKRKANVLSARTFPFYDKDVAYFVADFPAHVDSLSMIYESRRQIVETDLEREIFNQKRKVIKVVDSLKLHLVDPRTRMSNTQLIVTDRFYAKGLGLIEWGSDELKVRYRLTKILTDEWWSEFAQIPQVKM